MIIHKQNQLYLTIEMGPVSPRVYVYYIQDEHKISCHENIYNRINYACNCFIYRDVE